MTASSVLLILVGLFIIVNAPNFVGVIKGDKKFNLELNKDKSPATGAR